MHPVTQALVTVAAVVVTAAGAYYLASHIQCVDFYGLVKGCMTFR